jgi:hypothetical protein
MKTKPSITLGVTVLLALFITGCATNGGTTARAQEKSAAYAALKPWEKNYIAKGVVSTGFTPDMVYMAVGSPSKMQTVDAPAGSKAELWVYDSYYPSIDAVHMQHTPFTTEMPYQPARMESPAGEKKLVPAGMGATHPSISTTGGPQGGSMEPADLTSYTLSVLFQDGKVARMNLSPN